MTGKPSIFNKEIQDFVFENYALYSTSELKDKINEKFNTNLTHQQVLSFKRRKRLLVGSGNRIPLVIQEYIKANYKGKYVKDLVKEIKEKFGKDYTSNQISSYKKYNNLISGTHGKTIEQINGARAIKVGDIYENHGYLVRKTGVSKNSFVYLHRELWEKHHGEIPTGYSVVFKNQNRKDVRIENLMLISMAEHIYMASQYGYSKNGDINEVAILNTRIKKKLREIKKNE